jgi:hypothetical protein
MGVATGDMTPQDFVEFGLEIQKAGVVHYRKLIDVVNARPAFSKDELLALGQYIRQATSDHKRGALAFVIDPYRGEFAMMFSEMDAANRPARVFRSIHDARKWLADNPPEA